MPSKQEVGRRVRLARFRRELTLKEVAARSGMSATHISEIERGKTSPTIGALQRIAKALEERPAHFVEEHNVPRSILIRKDDRVKEYRCDADEQVTSMERLTANPPWGMLTVIRKVAKPGEALHRPPAMGELVAHCLRGMVRYTVKGEKHVLREGDTVQFLLDEGYHVENIGEDNSEVVAFAAFPGRSGW
ncbi:MAG: helix-turn-helix domain-containing protein [Candidatus Eisenbacteria bacterium]|nr:helix-turn-helix domain-containing protein [Candidatus Eisenbacteria bacterium]